MSHTKDVPGGGGGGAPTDVDYLVGTADATLSNEIVVGTTPGGELGGTWASPTVDSTHSGSAHHTQSHDHSAAGDGTTLKPAIIEIGTVSVSASLVVNDDDTFLGAGVGGAGSYVDIGTLGTSDVWFDARGSGADVSVKLRPKGAGEVSVEGDLAVTGTAFDHSKLTTVGADDHHAQAHESTDHTSVGFEAERATTAQTISDSTVTTVIFNDELEDTDTGYDTSTGIYTVPAGMGGVWLVTTGLSWEAGSTTRQLRILVGADLVAFNILDGTPTAQTAARRVRVSDGDEIKVQCFQNSGGDLDILAERRCFFSAERVAD